MSKTNDLKRLEIYLHSYYLNRHMQGSYVLSIPKMLVFSNIPCESFHVLITCDANKT